MFGFITGFQVQSTTTLPKQRKLTKEEKAKLPKKAKKNSKVSEEHSTSRAMASNGNHHLQIRPSTSKKKPDKKYTCYYCLREFISSAALRQHLCRDLICQPKHVARKAAAPTVAPKGCKEDQDEVDNYTIRCPICNVGVPTKNALKCHKYKHHGKGSKH